MSTFDCPVCMENLAIDGCYELACEHKICIDCLRGYLSVKINEKEVKEDQLICPRPECPCMVNEVTIRELFKEGDVSVYEKYISFTTDLFLEDPKTQVGANIRKCPSERCNYRFEYEPVPVFRNVSPLNVDSLSASISNDEDTSQNDPEILPGSMLFTCPDCESSYCLDCRANGGRVGPPHPGMTCEDRVSQLEKAVAERQKFEEWQRDNARADEMFEEVKRELGVKDCPSCTAAIERTQGTHSTYC